MSKNKNQDKSKKVIPIAVGLLVASLGGTSASNSYVYAVTQDIQGDEYDNSIPIETENGIIEINENNIVLSYENIRPEDELNNVKVLNDNGELIEGKIKGKYLSQIEMPPFSWTIDNYTDIYKINSDAGAALMSRADGYGRVIETLPDQTFVLSTDEKTENSLRSVLYINEKGILQGYVKDDLVEVVFREAKNNTNNNNNANNNTKETNNNLNANQNHIDIKNNREGTVSGIDAAYISYDDMIKVFSEGINDEYVYSGIGGNICIDDINGKMNFAYIRISCTYNCTPEFMLDDFYNTTLEQVRACEDYGVPYGFYAYSASISDYEAQMEANDIIDKIERLKNDLGPLKNNVLPLAIDVECEGGIYDRQYPYDVTYAKAYLANALKPVVGETILYAPAHILYGEFETNASKIFDLNEYCKLTGINKLWTPMPKEECYNSEPGGNTTDWIDGVKSQYPNWNIIATQEGMNINVSGIGSDVDINVMNKDEFDKWVR